MGDSKQSGQGSVARVLLVEDNDVNAMLLIEMMKLVTGRMRLRLEIDVAKTAEEARAKWPKDDEALVLLDLDLPDGRGEQVCKEMTRGASGADRPFVVCVSARVDQMPADSIRFHGIDRCLAKPVRVEELACRLSEWRDLRASEAETQDEEKLHVD